MKERQSEFLGRVDQLDAKILDKELIDIFKNRVHGI